MQRESRQQPPAAQSHATEEEAVRIAAASLHSSIRKFRQTCLPLLGPLCKGLPVKSTSAVFASRMTDEMTASALECLSVLPRDRALTGKRRREVLQWLDVSLTLADAMDDTMPLSLVFLNDLKERLTLKHADAAGGAASRLVGEPSPEALTCVPAVVVLRVGELLWAQRHTARAERLLWSEGVEEMLTAGSEASANLPAEAFVRSCVVLSKADEVPHASHEGTLNLLTSVIELWAWCKATDNINAEKDVLAALEEPPTKSLLACWFHGQSADAWSQSLTRIMRRVASLQQQAKKRCAARGVAPVSAAATSSATSPSRQQLRDQLLLGSPSRSAAAPPTAAAASPTVNHEKETPTAEAPTRVVQSRASVGLQARVTSFLSRLNAKALGSAGMIGIAIAVVVLVVQLLMVRYAKATAAPTTRRALSL
jgi:hypothetical protein